MIAQFTTVLIILPLLAARTEGGAALGDDDFDEGRAAAFARKPAATVGFHALAVTAGFAVHVAVVGLPFAEGGAAILNTDTEDVANGAVEGFALVGCEGAGAALGMNRGGPEGFVGIDVTDTGNERLIEQQRLDGTLTVGEQLFEIGAGKVFGERIGPKLPKNFLRVVDEFPASKFAGVAKVEFHATGEEDFGAVEFTTTHGEATGHAEVYHPVLPRTELDLNPLSGSADGVDLGTAEGAGEGGGCEGFNHAGPVDANG